MKGLKDRVCRTDEDMLPKIEWSYKPTRLEVRGR
jgi:hypothetical protein